MEILEVLRSYKCWIVGIISMALGYVYIVAPFLTANSPLIVVGMAVIFLLLFGTSLACMVRMTVVYAKQSKGSLTSLLAYILGFASLQTCFASGACVSGLAVPLVSALFPSFMRGFFENFAPLFLGLSILLLIYSLFSMKCFVDTKVGIKEVGFKLTAPKKTEKRM